MAKVRRVASDIRATPEELEAMLRSEVLKRDVVDGDDAVHAQAALKKAMSRVARARGRAKEESSTTGTDDAQPSNKTDSDSKQPT